MLLTDLDPSTEYRVTVMAENEAGRSAPSPSRRTKTFSKHLIHLLTTFRFNPFGRARIWFLGSFKEEFRGFLSSNEYQICRDDVLCVGCSLSIDPALLFDLLSIQRLVGKAKS